MRSRRYRRLLSPVIEAMLVLAVLIPVGCARQPTPPPANPLAGDWDYYRMLGAAPNGGFEARRRFGFAHFDGASGEGAWLKRRSGEVLDEIENVSLNGDALVLSLGGNRTIKGTLAGNTIEARLYRADTPTDRVWFERRSAPPAWEPYYPLWPGPVSEAKYKVTIDPAVPMTARDGTTLMNYVARPVGEGPFGVVMERTPYLRTDTANGVFWASRGYIYVKQDVRGRGGSGGVLDMNAMQEQDGYDAVEWAAALPGSNGKVGHDRPRRTPGSTAGTRPSRSRPTWRRSRRRWPRPTRSGSCRTSTWSSRRPSCPGSA